MRAAGAFGAVVMACLALLVVPLVVIVGVVGALPGMNVVATELAAAVPGALPPGGIADIPGPALAAYVAGAGYCPGLAWTVLAGIGKVESDHGRADLPGVRSGANPAGAEGPMQFLPATFDAYAVVEVDVAEEVHTPAPVDTPAPADTAAASRHRGRIKTS